ncbi:MAG: DUF4328 domain-containing protein [Gammaproteobacteria bacterium]|nr:DUF4328 domain-containing protein [Gammaproteobacteria bacterium]
MLIGLIQVSGIKFTPSWSVSWYFIPIANLWKPYQAIKEIWRTSVIPYNWSSQPVSSLLSWWWFSWIVFNVSGVAKSQIGIGGGEILVGLILSVYNGSGAIFAINRDHFPQIWQLSSDWGEWAVSWRWEGLLVEWMQANLVSQLCDVIRISSCLILITIISRVHKMQMSHAKLK